MWSKLWGGPKAYHKWADRLTWYRLRYLDPAGPTRCLSLLSRPEACGRLVLCFRPGAAVCQLYLGVPPLPGRLLQRMVADFDFSVKPAPPAFSPPAPQPMTAVTDFPWERPFTGQIVNGVAYVSQAQAGKRGGDYLPQPSATEAGVTWSLPAEPPPGLTLRPAGGEGRPPSPLTPAQPDPRRWLLGRSAQGLPVQVGGRVNLYGREAAVTDWLLAQVTQQLALDHTGLVVIDGSGLLVGRLKRKTAVTRLLGSQLTYVDLDGAGLSEGFNPLGAVPGECEADLVARWQGWFAGMNVHPHSGTLLAQARQDGIEDIPGLRQWLQQLERRGRPVAAGNGTGPVRVSAQALASLNLALNRLTTNRSLREWLAWPVNPFGLLPDGALLFGCQATSWERQQLLRAVLLAAGQRAGVRLVLYGLPWPAIASDQLTGQGQVVIGNGPLLPESVVVLTECHDEGAAALAVRFLNGDARLQESLVLLRQGEGMVVAEGVLFFTDWLARENPQRQRH